MPEESPIACSLSAPDLPERLLEKTALVLAELVNAFTADHVPA